MALCVWGLSISIQLRPMGHTADVQSCSVVWQCFNQGRTRHLLRKVCLDFFFFASLLYFVVRNELVEDQDLFLSMWGMYLCTCTIVEIANLLFSNVINISSSCWSIVLFIGLLILSLFWNGNLLELDRVCYFEISVE